LREASSFEEHYNSPALSTHKQRYRDQWDEFYKAAYEAKHPVGK